MKKLELVLPAYNEAENLPRMISRFIEAAKKFKFQSSEVNLVIVNNGSRDQSAAVLKELQSGDHSSWFRVVTVVENQGYGYGLFEGLKTTQSDYVAWSHADMQCDPADVFRSYQIVIADSKRRTIVKGVRSGRHFRDRVVTQVFEIFARLILGLKINEINAQPKVFPRECLKLIQSPPRNFAFDLYFLFMVARSGYVIETISVEFPPRIHGTSKWASHFMSRYKTILGMIAYMVQLRSEEGSI